jgi:hypothetical protein
MALMKPIWIRKRRDLSTARSGSTLVIVVAIAGILAITGTGLLSLGLSTYRRAVYASQEVAARGAAEAGVAKALFVLKSYDGVHLPSATNEAVPECSGRFSYTVSLGTPDGLVVDATGMAGNVTKTIHTRLTARNALFCGIAIQQGATIKTGAQVLPAPGGSSPQLLTNTTTAGAVNLEASSITFQGDVVVGPGGNPPTVLVGESVVSGTISVAAATTPFPAVTPPTGLPVHEAITHDTTITEDAQYSEINLTGEAEEITIQGNRIVYVTGTVNLQNKACIIVTPGSSLTLYVGGSVTLRHRASIREENYDPTKVLILGAASCTQIDLDDTFQLYGGLYAPTATVGLHDAAEVHGAIACNLLDPMEMGAKLYYDDRMAGVRMSTGSNSYAVSYWQDN